MNGHTGDHSNGPHPGCPVCEELMLQFKLPVPVDLSTLDNPDQEPPGEVLRMLRAKVLEVTLSADVRMLGTEVNLRLWVSDEEWLEGREQFQALAALSGTPGWGHIRIAFVEG